VDAALLRHDEERALVVALEAAEAAERFLTGERFSEAVTVLAGLRAPLDAFFVAAMVNDDDPAIRLNRLRILAAVRAAINRVADLSAIEG
jgi:glycyl-tRNA synthetase beta chain